MTIALIDGKWVDFDATLPVRHSAAHVLTGTSSLADGLGSTELSSLLVLLGNLEIEVLDVGYGNDGNGHESDTPQARTQPDSHDNRK